MSPAETSQSRKWAPLPDGSEFLRSLYEHAAVGIQEVTSEGRFLFVNTALCRMLGYRRNELLRKRYDDLVHPDDLAHEVKLLERRHRSTTEKRLLHSSGTYVWTVVTSLPVKYGTLGRSRISFIRDIRDRRLAQERFGLVVASAPNAMIVVDHSGEVILANIHTEDLFGYRREELIGLSVDILVPAGSGQRHPALRQNSLRDPRRRIMGGKREVTGRHKNGAQVSLEITLHPLEFENRKWFLASILDISERKEAETALRDSEDRLRLLLNSTAEGVFGIDVEGNFTFSNRSALSALGYKSESQLVGKNIHQVIHHTRVDGTPYPIEDCPILNTVRTGTSAHLDDELLWRADGGSFHAEYWSNPQLKGEQVVGAVVAFVDITSRLGAAEALRKSEEKFSKAFAGGPMALTLTSLRTHRYLDVNEAFERYTGYQRSEVVEKTPFDIDIWVDPAQRAELVRRTLSAGSVRDLEVRYRTKVGKVCVGLESAEVIEIAGERCLLSAIVDITDSKRALDDLRRSEEKFRTTFQDAPAGMTIVSPEGSFLAANKAFCEFLGYTEEELLRLDVIPVTHPEDRAATQISLRNVNSERVERVEKRYLHKSGEIRWGDLSRSVIRDSEGNPLYWISQIVDITERKTAEEPLRETEQRFRMVANSAPVLIWMSGPDKLCNFFNEPWLQFTGRSLEAELGSGWLERVHPDDRRDVIQEYTQSFDRRVRFTLEYRLLRHDGQYRWVLDTGVPRFNADGSFAGYIGSCIDDTERRRGVEALRNVGGKLLQAQEQERKRIAQELHDDINQRLAMVSIEIEQLKDSNLIATPLSDRLEKLRKTTTTIAGEIQALSHRLHSSKLEYLGMIPAMNHFCKEIADHKKVHVSFVHTGTPISLPEEISLGIFRVFQEALHNAVKYSGVKNIEVQVDQEPSEIRLVVRDSGIGFNPDTAIQGRGLGLISMLERVKLMNGTIAINSRAGHGTEITAVVPVTSRD